MKHHRISVSCVWALVALSSLPATSAWGQCKLSELDKISPPPATPSDPFGQPIAVNGIAMVVGSRYDDSFGSDAGCVLLYEPGGTMLAGTLFPADPSPSQEFGASVAISGTTLVVGAPGDDSVTTNSGAVYVFERLFGLWWQTDKFLPTIAVNGDAFGYCVAIDGNQLVIGTRGSTPRACVYERSGSQWTLSAVLNASQPKPIDSVAISSDRCLVGSVARVHYYRKVASSWPQIEVLSKQTSFGFSVAMAGGTTAVVGDPGFDNGTGRVYVYSISANSLTEIGALVGQDSVAQDGFARSVAISGGRVVCGAPGHGGQAGAVYVFEKPAAIWFQTLKVMAKVPIAAEQLGSSLAVQGDTILSGAPFGPGGGAIYVLPGTPSVLISKFGSGCSGTGAFIPNLKASGCPMGGGTLTFSLDSCPGGSSALLFFAPQALTSVPPVPCPVLIGPILPAFVVLPLFGSGPGNGSISITGPLPSGLGAFAFVAQALVADAIHSTGYSSSNGVEVHVHQ